MDTKSLKGGNTCIFCRTNFHGDKFKVVDLGEIYPSTFVDKPEDCLAMAKADLSLTKCPACDFVQLNKVLPPDTMYRNYWYRSDLNSTMSVALKDVVFETMKRLYNWPTNVLDIGCNDGTLLGFYANDVAKVGVDPALNLNTKNCDLFINDYFSGKDDRLGENKFDIITAIAMFYDVIDPYSFLEGIKHYLSAKGIFVIQMTDLYCTFKVNAFDNVCHEHIAYWTLDHLQRILALFELEVFDVIYNDVNGSSIRAYICHKGAYPKTDELMIAEDNEKYIMDNQPFDKLNSFIDYLQYALLKELNTFKHQGKRVFALGASTKGNTLLQVFDINAELLPYCLEVSKDKFGKYTVGSNLLIISEAEGYALRPD
jgi:hypothetical protein